MSISAVLLAGGESRRMGLDKATLIFREKPLWERPIELLRKLEPSEIFVSARKNPAWLPNDIRFVADDAPSRGPLSGLAATMARMATGHVITLAVDMPFMSVEFLQSMLERISPGRGVIPRIGERFEPLAAIYPRAVDVDFAEALKGEDYALQHVAEQLVGKGTLSVFPVSRDHESLFRNLNEPADLDSAVC